MHSSGKAGGRRHEGPLTAPLAYHALQAVDVIHVRAQQGVGGRDFGLAKGRIVLVITGVGFVDDLCRHPIEHHFARCGAFKLA
jgi:hypothetical protein